MMPLVSVRYYLVMSSTLDKPGDFMNVAMVMAGEFEAPGRWRVERVRKVGRRELRVTTLSVGGERYVRSHLSPVWSTDTEMWDQGGNPLGLLSLDSGAAWVTGWSAPVAVTVDGVSVYHVGGGIPLAALEDALGKGDFGGESASIEFWVRAGDLMVHRVKAVVDGVDVFSQGSPPFQTVLDMSLSGYGESFGIEAPDPGQVLDPSVISPGAGLPPPPVPELSGLSPAAAPVPASAVSASGGGPPLLSAADVLRAVSAASAEAGSGHYESVVSSEVDGGESFVSVEIRMSGDFQLPDRESALVDFDMGPFSMRIEMVSVGGDVYVRDPLSGAWGLESSASGLESVPGGMSGLLLSGGLQEDIFQDSVRLVGGELLDGDPVYHLAGGAPPGFRGGLSSGAELSVESASVEYWVGAEDFLVRRILVEFAAAHASPAGPSMPVLARMDVKFSGYGKDVDIVRPELSPGTAAPVPSG